MHKMLFAIKYLSTYIRYNNRSDTSIKVSLVKRIFVFTDRSIFFMSSTVTSWSTSKARMKWKIFFQFGTNHIE